MLLLPDSLFPNWGLSWIFKSCLYLILFLWILLPELSLILYKTVRILLIAPMTKSPIFAKTTIWVHFHYCMSLYTVCYPSNHLCWSWVCHIVCTLTLHSLRISRISLLQQPVTLYTVFTDLNPWRKFSNYLITLFFKWYSMNSSMNCFLLELSTNVVYPFGINSHVYNNWPLLSYRSTVKFS